MIKACYDKGIREPEKIKSAILRECGINLFDEEEADKAQNQIYQDFCVNILTSIAQMKVSNKEGVQDTLLATMSDDIASLSKLLGINAATTQDLIDLYKKEAGFFESLSSENMNFEDFKQVFKVLFKDNLDTQKLDEFMEYCQKSDISFKDKEFKEKFKEVFNSDFLQECLKENTIDKVFTTAFNIVLTLTLLKGFSNTTEMQTLMTNAKDVLQNTLNLSGKLTKLGLSVTGGAATMGATTLTEETLLAMLKQDPTIAENIPEDVLKSAGFGAFAGAVNTLLVEPLCTGKTVESVYKTLDKIITKKMSLAEFTVMWEKAAAPLIQSGALQKAYSMAVNTTAFTAYNVAGDVIDDLFISQEGNISKYGVGKYLGQSFLENLKGILSFEGVSALISFMATGKIAASKASELTSMKDVVDCYSSINQATIEPNPNCAEGQAKTYILRSSNGQAMVVTAEQATNYTAFLMKAESCYRLAEDISQRISSITDTELKQKYKQQLDDILHQEFTSETIDVLNDLYNSISLSGIKDMFKTDSDFCKQIDNVAGNLNSNAMSDFLYDVEVQGNFDTQTGEPITPEARANITRSNIEKYIALNSSVTNFNTTIRNNYAGIEFLNKLTVEEQQILARGLAADGMQEAFLMLMNDGKPAGLFYTGSGSKLTTAVYTDVLAKLQGDKFDVVKRGKGDSLLVTNKDMTKQVIAENRDLFIYRLSLNKDASVDEIYSALVDENGDFAKNIAIANSVYNDVSGLIFGYPKYNTLIFELEQASGMDFRERDAEDLTGYKQTLISTLYGEKSPYKEMSTEFKQDLEEKINGITKIETATDVIGNNGYGFVYYTEEPTEIARINTQTEHVNEELGKINSGSSASTDDYSVELLFPDLDSNFELTLPENFPEKIVNKNGIELRFENGQYIIYAEGKEVGYCTLYDGKSIDVADCHDDAPEGWNENGKTKPYLEVTSIFIPHVGNGSGYGRKTMQAIYELSKELGYEGRVHVDQLDDANGFYTKLGFSGDGTISRFFTPTEESLAKLYKGSTSTDKVDTSNTDIAEPIAIEQTPQRTEFEQRKQAVLDKVLNISDKGIKTVIKAEDITAENIEFAEYIAQDTNLSTNYQIVSMMKHIDSAVKLQFALDFVTETNGKIDNYDNGMETVVDAIDTPEKATLMLDTTKMLLAKGMKTSSKSSMSSILLSTDTTEQLAMKDELLDILDRVFEDDKNLKFEILNRYQADLQEMYDLLKFLPEDSSKNKDIYKDVAKILKNAKNAGTNLVIYGLQVKIYAATRGIAPTPPDISVTAIGWNITEQQIDDAVEKLIKDYSEAEGDIHKKLVDLGFADIGSFEDRVKSKSSLKDKISNYIKEHPEEKLKGAIADVRDAYACRTVIAKEDFSSNPEIQEFIKAGNLDGAILRAAELQSQPAVDMLKNMIDAQARGESDFKITRLSNYVSPDGIPYFSEAQLADLKQYGADRGIEIDYVGLIKEGETGWDEIDKQNYKPTTKSQPSGYTAFQMNMTTKDGKVIEWQCRGEDVNNFAEGEHLPYDMRTGKNVIGTHEELRPFYEPMQKLLDEKTMPEKAYKSYQEYLTDYYTHLRKLELGFESKEPQLADYEVDGYKFDSRLEAKNLVKLHDVAKKLKDGEITQDKAREEYFCNQEVIGEIREGVRTETDKIAEKYNLPQEIVDIILRNEPNASYDSETNADIDLLIQEYLDNPEIFTLKTSAISGSKGADEMPKTLVSVIANNSRTALYDATGTINRPINDVINEYMNERDVFDVKECVYENSGKTATGEILPQKLQSMIARNPKYADVDVTSGANINEVIKDYLQNPEIYQIKEKAYTQKANSTQTTKPQELKKTKLTDVTNTHKSIAEKLLGVDPQKTKTSSDALPDDLADFIWLYRLDEKVTPQGVSINNVIEEYLRNPADFTVEKALTNELLKQIKDIDGELCDFCQSLNSVKKNGKATILNVDTLNKIKSIAQIDVEFAKEVLLHNDYSLELAEDLVMKFSMKDIKKLMFEWGLDLDGTSYILENYRKLISTIDKELKSQPEFKTGMKLYNATYQTNYAGDNEHIALGIASSDGDIVLKFNNRTGKYEGSGVQRTIYQGTGENGEWLSNYPQELEYGKETSWDMELNKDGSISSVKIQSEGQNVIPHVDNDVSIKSNKFLSTDIETYVSTDGKKLTHEEFIQSEIEGEYEIYDYDSNGNMRQIGFAEKLPNGHINIERTLESFDGTTTQYLYHDDPQGNRILNNVITQPDGQKLDIKKSVKKLSDNHSVTTSTATKTFIAEDGTQQVKTVTRQYDMEIFPDKVVSTKLNPDGTKSDETVTYRIIDYKSLNLDKKINNYMIKLAKQLKIDLTDQSIENQKNTTMLMRKTFEHFGLSDTIDKSLVPLLQQLNGEELFKLKISNLSMMEKSVVEKLENAKDSQVFSSGVNSEANAFAVGNLAVSVGNALMLKSSCVEHEFGHIYFDFLELNNDPVLRKIYEEERSEVINKFGSLFTEKISYFLCDTQIGDASGYRGINELTAETNELMNMHSQWNNTGARTVILQHYFPKTIAYIAEKQSFDIFEKNTDK